MTRALILPLVVLATFPIAVHAEDEDVSRQLATTVCVIGDVAGGKFEASGFIVPPGTHVMTTAHGIEPTRNLRIKLADGRVFAARLERVGNERADLALLGVLGPKLDSASLGSIESLKAGARVLAVGCPSGFEFTVTQGVVSSIRPSDLGYPLIQTDVPVNPGSSGGPLFDEAGNVVGIVKGRFEGRERIHFALPIDLGKALLDEIRNERRAYELFNGAILEGRVADKVRLYREALALKPDLVEAHYNLGVALDRLGSYSEAETEYRETLRLVPDYRPAILNLGATLYTQRRFAEAVDLFRTALKQSPRSVELRNNLAEAYRALGEHQNARREFETILKQSPDYAPAHYGLGVLYDDELGDRRQAVAHYRRYLDLAPEAADAVRVREWLRQAEERK